MATPHYTNAPQYPANPQSSETQYQKETQSGERTLAMIVVGLLVLFIAGYGIYTYKQTNRQAAQIDASTGTVTENGAASPAPSETVPATTASPAVQSDTPDGTTTAPDAPNAGTGSSAAGSPDTAPAAASTAQ